MIEPYNAVGLIPTFWGIRRREDIQKNIEHLNSLTAGHSVGDNQNCRLKVYPQPTVQPDEEREEGGSEKGPLISPV